MNTMDAAADVLIEASRILVFTGAGISTESGIPDFRGPHGVWTKVDPADFTIDRYLADPEIRRRSWRMRRESGALDAHPNSGHLAITRLWDRGRLVGCVTQNIDGLHQRAGLPGDAVVELHGNAHRTVCVACRVSVPTTEVLERVSDGDEDPSCTRCGGILKADVVFFGELLPETASQRAFAWADTADAVVAVGSTLSVYPAAYVPLHALRRGMPLVIVNAGPTEMDRLATVRLEGPAGTLLPELAARLG